MQDFTAKVNSLVIEKFFANMNLSPSAHNFTEDGSLALGIIEELKRREGAIFIIHANGDTNGLVWIVGNKPKTMVMASMTEGRLPEDDSFAAAAPTFALAASLAALKSINVNPKDN